MGGGDLDPEAYANFVRAVNKYNKSGNLADFEKSHGRFVICDFVCPTKETRENFDADIVIWMDTIKEGRFEDTNKIFISPITSRFQDRNVYG